MNLIPTQRVGDKTDNLYGLVCTDRRLAKKTYVAARNKLLQINNWGKTANNILQTEFYLCNEKGEEVNRQPQMNDYIKINLLGPGSSSGDGFDWVKIEEIIHKQNDELEFTLIKVRPAVCPLTAGNDIAHFFDAAATSTFIVSRIKNEVIAEIHGRNEEPNTNTKKVADKVRNTMVAKLAAVKFSDVQWKTLCKGFLS